MMMEQLNATATSIAFKHVYVAGENVTTTSINLSISCAFSNNMRHSVELARAERRMENTLQVHQPLLDIMLCSRSFQLHRFVSNYLAELN